MTPLEAFIGAIASILIMIVFSLVFVLLEAGRDK
jgi:hypothetical protein